MRLPPLLIDSIIKNALLEDIGHGDITTQAIIPCNQSACGEFIAKEKLILSGRDVVCRVFYFLDETAKCNFVFEDGDEINAGEIIASAEGPGWVLLNGERVALNFLQRLCGIATLTRKYVKEVESYHAKILPTRKTTPGLRFLEKYSVCVGGGGSHRFRLDDGILIKENHIKLAGGIKNAVERIKQNIYHGMKIEVEVRNLKEFKQALQSGVDAVLLDNMKPEEVAKAVGLNQQNTLLEVSGGINLANVKEYAAAGVNFISIGALTHSAPAVDISFLLK